jgi:hypothetical protein
MSKDSKKKEPMKVELASGPADLNDIQFKNRDVVKWSKKDKARAERKNAPSITGLARLGGSSQSSFRRRKK